MTWRSHPSLVESERCLYLIREARSTGRWEGGRGKCPTWFAWAWGLAMFLAGIGCERWLF